MSHYLPPSISSPVAIGVSISALSLVGGLATGLGATDDAARPALPGTQTTVPAPTAHSWELPAIKVFGERETSQRDEDLVGSYGQPRWSTVRMFSEVRTYVIPEGQAEFEYWLFYTTPSRSEVAKAREAGDPRPKSQIKQMYEVEFGLGHRLQLDLYQVYVKDGSDGNNELDATKFELRYALADWDKIFGNPTIYAEWEQAAHGADSVEFKALFSGSVSGSWIWGTNLVYEQKTGDLRDRGLEWNSAVAKNVIDQRLSLGVETNFANVSNRVDASGTARESHWELLAGPSLRFYPIPRMHLILSQFIGLNKDAPQAKTAVIAGWEF